MKVETLHEPPPSEDEPYVPPASRTVMLLVWVGVPALAVALYYGLYLLISSAGQ